MRIGAFTDIHGAFDVVEQILRHEDTFDVVVLGGDLTTNGTEFEVEEGIHRVQDLACSVRVVGGNMDPARLEKTFDRLGVSINGKGIVLQNVGFFGVSAAPFSPLHTPHEISEDNIARLAEQGFASVLSARWKVFVPHAPPYGTSLDRIFSGRHVGSTAIRQFVERRQPDIVVCGHIHEARGTASLNSAKMINCGAAHDGFYATITICDDGIVLQNRSFSGSRW